MCPINGTGYGITSTNICVSLSSELDMDVSLFGIGQLSTESEFHKEVLIRALENAVFYDSKAPTLKIWHQHDLALRPGSGLYTVMPFFELDTLQKNEIHQINQADIVFTPTKWSASVLKKNNINKKIVVAPLGADSQIFNPMNFITEPKIGDNYVFLHVGKWEKRKGQDFLLKAFEKAFSKEDKVELWLCPHNPFLNEDELSTWYKLVETNKLSDKITILKRQPTQSDLAKIMSHSDCGIFLSRAEGWNNEIPEMMLMNKAIIATNYSAHTEYLTKQNSFMVEVDKTETAYDGKWFHGQGSWGYLGDDQLSQTIEHMRFVYNNRVQKNAFGVSTGKKYSWKNTATIVKKTVSNH